MWNAAEMLTLAGSRWPHKLTFALQHITTIIIISNFRPVLHYEADKDACRAQTCAIAEWATRDKYMHGETGHDGVTWTICFSRGNAIYAMPGMHMGHYNWTITTSSDPSSHFSYSVLLGPTELQPGAAGVPIVARAGDHMWVKITAWPIIEAQADS